MNCPICSAPLASQVHEGIAHESCTAGHGEFVTFDSLKWIVRTVGNDRPDSEERSAIAAEASEAIESIEEQDRACPECGEPMEKAIYAYESGVRIDRCDAHGIWLDASELAQIEAWHEGSTKLVDAESAEWAARLDVEAQTLERKMDEAAISVHSPWTRWLYRRVERNTSYFTHDE